jgi:hypothetical protein
MMERMMKDGMKENENNNEAISIPNQDIETHII